MNNDDIDQKEAPEDAILAFQDKLMDELGAKGFSVADKETLQSKLESLVNTRIVNLVMIHLPKDKIDGFAELVESDDNEKTVEFLRANIQNFDDKIMAEMMQIRDDLLKKYINENK